MLGNFPSDGDAISLIGERAGGETTDRGEKQGRFGGREGKREKEEEKKRE